MCYDSPLIFYFVPVIKYYTVCTWLMIYFVIPKSKVEYFINLSFFFNVNIYEHFYMAEYIKNKKMKSTNKNSIKLSLLIM